MSQYSFSDLIQQQVSDWWFLQLQACLFFTFCWIEAMCTTPRPPLKPKPDLVTDMFYWMLIPSIRVLSRIISVAIFLVLASSFGIDAGTALLDGYGPVAQQPRWLIVIELFFLMDLALYWAHRAFHRFPLLWRFHAIHHSAKFVRWATTGRIHPVNEITNYLVAIVPFFALGFPLGDVLILVPVITLWVIAAHTQWDVGFGPLRGVLVSPRFHRWHHTHSDQGGNKNFANFFSLWDRLFGTFYLPEGRSPERFGLDEDDLPESYLAHLIYPFRRRPLRSATTAEQPAAASAAGRSNPPSDPRSAAAAQ